MFILYIKRYESPLRIGWLYSVVHSFLSVRGLRKLSVNKDLQGPVTVSQKPSEGPSVWGAEISSMINQPAWQCAEFTLRVLSQGQTAHTHTHNSQRQVGEIEPSTTMDECANDCVILKWHLVASQMSVTEICHTYPGHSCELGGTLAATSDV